MSSNKKIRNRINKLFTGLQSTGGDGTATQAEQQPATLGQAAESVALAAVQATTRQTLGGAPAIEATTAVLTVPFQAASNWNLLHLETETAHEWDEEEQSLVRQVADQLGLALQNAQLFQETQKAANQMAAIAEIASRISTILDLQPMIQVAVNLTQRRFNLYHAHLFLLEKNGHTLRVHACGWKEGDELEGTHGSRDIDLNAPISIVARAARTRQAVVINAVHNEPGWLPNQALPDVQSEMAIPVLSGEQLLGVLNVHSEHINFFTTEDTAIMTTLAAQIGSAIQNATLVQAIQKTAEEMRIINTVVTQTAATSDLKTTLYNFVGQLATALSISDVKVVMEQSNKALKVVAQASQEGMDDFEVPEQFVPTDNPILRKVFSTREPLTITNVPEEPALDWDRSDLEYLNTHTLVILPLIAQEAVSGLVILYIYQSGRQLSADELRLAQTLVVQAGIAIERAQLFDEAKKRAAELAVLNEILRAASAEIELPKILEAVYTKMGLLFPIDAFIFALYDPQTETIDYKFMVDEGVRYEMGVRPLGDNMTSETIREKKARLILRTPAELEPESEDNTLIGNTQKVSASLMYAPVMKGNEVLGVISVQSYRLQAYTSHELTLIESIANQLANAVQNATLVENIQKSLNDLALINRLTSAVSGSLEIQSSLQLIAEELNKTFQIGHVGITLFDEARTALILTADAPLPPDGKGDIGLAISVEASPATQQVLETRKPVFVYDVSTNPLTENIKEVLTHRGTKNMLIFPLLSGNEIVGTVGFDTFTLDRTFTDDEIRLVETILFQVASAIRNTQLFEQTDQALSQTERLYRIIRDVSIASNEDPILRSVVEIVSDTNLAEALMLEYIDLDKRDPHTAQVELLASWSATSQEVARPGTRYYVRDLPFYQMWSGNLEDPLLIPDLVNIEHTDPALREQFSQAGYHGFALIPLLQGGRWFGVITLTWREPHNFTNEEQALLRAVISAVSPAVANLRSLRDAQQRARREKILREVTARVRATTDPDMIIRTAVRELGQALNVPTFLKMGTTSDPAKAPPALTGVPKPARPKKPSEGGA